jgi:hypothetical protein
MQTEIEEETTRKNWIEIDEWWCWQEIFNMKLVFYFLLFFLFLTFLNYHLWWSLKYIVQLFDALSSLRKRSWFLHFFLCIIHDYWYIRFHHLFFYLDKRGGIKKDRNDNMTRRPCRIGFYQINDKRIVTHTERQQRPLLLATKILDFISITN